MNIKNYIVDVATGVKSHLIHYIKYGKWEELTLTGLDKNQNMKSLCLDESYIHQKGKSAQKLNVAIIVHIFYFELWGEILNKLKQLNPSYHLYITVPDELYDKVLKLKFPNVPVKIYKYENIGMDIYPFLKVLGELKKDNIDIFCKLHTKKGNPQTGELWRKTLLEHTVGSNQLFTSVVSIFGKDKELKIVGSAFFYKSVGYLSKRFLNDIKKTLKKITIHKKDLNNEGFFAGSMFWGRVDDFLPLREQLLSKTMFRQSKNITNADETYTHIIERMLGLIHLERKKVGLIIGEEKNFYLRLIDTNKARPIKNNITETIRLLSQIP